jgi:hypothetical protein
MAPGPASRLSPVIERALHRVCLRQISVTVAECAALLLVLLPALLLFQALADWWLNLPWTVRLILLLGDAAAVVFLLYHRAFLPLRGGWPLARTALQIERRIPEFRSALISAVELAQSPFHGSPALAQELFDRVTKDVQTLDLSGRAVRTERLKKWTLWAILSVGIVGVIAISMWPCSGILLARVFLSPSALPTRTLVEPISREEIAVVGTEVVLSARARGVVPKAGRLEIVDEGNVRREVALSPSPGDPAVFSATISNVQKSFRYRFVLNDGTGPDFSVTAKIAPVLEQLRIVQRYPAYTRLPETEMAPGNLTLLAGSKVRIEGVATEALQEATLSLDGTDQVMPLKATGKEVSGEFTVPTEGLSGLTVSLRNLDGVTSRDDAHYPVELVRDQPPAVDLSSPEGNRLSVLLRTPVPVTYAARDDFGLKNVLLKYEVVRPASPAGEEPAMETGEITLAVPSGKEEETVSTWNLAGQKPALTEGCTITYWIEATDNNEVTGPGVGSTPKKTLAILSEADKRAELLEVLAARAAEIEAVSAAQNEVNEDLDRTIRKSIPTSP